MWILLYFGAMAEPQFARENLFQINEGLGIADDASQGSFCGASTGAFQDAEGQAALHGVWLHQ
jgi:hypothetical protein